MTSILRFWNGLLLIALALMAAPARAQENANLADFDFVVASVERNYAGWETKTAGERRALLDDLTRRLRADVARGNAAILRQAISEWVAWFDDGHLQVQWALASASAMRWRAILRPLTEDAAEARLAALGTARQPIEGIWTIDDSYRLAVIRRGSGAALFDAVVLATTAGNWRAGEVKAELRSLGDGRFAVRYGTGDRSEVQFNADLRSGGDVLDVGELGIWRRAFNGRAEAEAALHRWPGDIFAITRINASTLYMRLPSFGSQHTDTVRTLIADHAAELAATPNLIIDIRHNGGGSDFVYDPIIPYFYTRPIWRIGVEVRVSEDNRLLRSAVAEEIASASPEAAASLRSESARMVGATTAFIRREPPVEIVRLSDVPANPQRIALLIDGAGSSAENFIMDARQSRRVTLMGQANSAGVIDFGEMMSMAAPSGRFTIAWATTRSLRLPGDPVDPDGIAPDVRIPADSADPVRWAAAWLEAQRR